MLLLQEFDFDIVVRKGKQHNMVDHLSRIKTGELPIGVNDELPHVILFKVNFVPDCYDGIVEYMKSERTPLEMFGLEANKLIRRVGPYQLIAGQLYIKGKDEASRRCARP